VSTRKESWLGRNRNWSTDRPGYFAEVNRIIRIRNGDEGVCISPVEKNYGIYPFWYMYIVIWYNWNRVWYFLSASIIFAFKIILGKKYQICITVPLLRLYLRNTKTNTRICQQVVGQRMLFVDYLVPVHSLQLCSRDAVTWLKAKSFFCA